MSVLAKLTAVSTLSLAGLSFGCLAHGLPGQPDFAVYQSTGTFGGAVGLYTRSDSTVVFFNSGGSAISGEFVAQVVHSIIS
jgi:hypothetical protein